MVTQPAGRGPELMGVFILFVILSTVSTLLRVYCRAGIIKQFGLDDWLAIVAWALFICHASFAITGVYHGSGQHAWNITPQTDEAGLKWWWFCEIFYVLGNMAIKASIVILLLRIMIEPSQRMTLYITLAVVELYSLAFFMVFIFQCQPSSYFWSRITDGEGTCINNDITVDVVYGYSAISCVSDWLFSIMPCVAVWRLQMRMKERLLCALVLALSAVASVATIARIPYVHDLANQADFLHATVDVAIWSCAEEGLAITACACATLRPLFRHFLGQTRLGESRSEGERTVTGWRHRSRPSVSVEAHGHARSVDAVHLTSYDTKRDRSPGDSVVTGDWRTDD